MAETLEAQQIRERMTREGVNIGTLVELEVHRFADLNTATTTVPTYHRYPDRKEELGKKRHCSGYVAELTDKYVGLLPVWDKVANAHPDELAVGGIRINWDAINSYRKL